MLNSTFRFVSERESVAARLPRKVRVELARAAALIPLFEANATIPWDGEVLISGFLGVGFRQLPEALECGPGGGASGRQSERLRFFDPSAKQAHRSSLGSQLPGGSLDMFRGLADALLEESSAGPGPDLDCGFFEIDRKELGFDT